jgi:electron transport complex protein RnfG
MAELRAILTVSAIGLGCAALLAATHRLTEAPIERNQTAAEREILVGLLGSGYDVRLPAPDLSVQPAIWDYCGRAVLARLDVPGYGGPIRLLFTLDKPTAEAPAAARVGRVVLLGHQETPGITDFLQDGRWLDGLAAATAGQLRAADAITGATITSRAITGGLAKALDAPERLGSPRALECSP